MADTPELSERCLAALADAFSPDAYPSQLWIDAQAPEVQRELLRWASALTLHAEDPSQRVPPAPDVLKRWADESVPKVTLVFREGTNDLSEQAEGLLEALHDKLDLWFRHAYHRSAAYPTETEAMNEWPRWTVALECDHISDDAPVFRARTTEQFSEEVDP
jgi:hypothetical protein